MDVSIGEVHSTVEAVGGDALLTPDVLSQIVRAVTAELKAQKSLDSTHQSEVAVRSVLDQQRGAGPGDG